MAASAPAGRAEYRVAAVPWDGHDEGAAHLEQLLNGWAAEGWELLSVIPTTAGTSVRSFVSANAAANTTEIALILRRQTG
ncbi:MAG: hypothetical protein R2754_02400 [Microthrixaceae bacterium]